MIVYAVKLFRNISQSGRRQSCMLNNFHVYAEIVSLEVYALFSDYCVEYLKLLLFSKEHN